MAVILSIAGGFVGFVLAVVSFAFMDVSLLTAFAIWWGIGSLFLALGICLSLAPSGRRQQSAMVEVV